MSTKNVLVLCTGNSCRSQMAQGYLKSLGQGWFNAYSAGVETHGLNPDAVAAMKRDGIDISGHTSNHIDEYADVEFSAVITVCDNAKERCPYFPTQAKKLHHNFSDPSKYEGSPEDKIKEFDRVRGEIKAYCQNFVEEWKQENTQG
ncbi:arsenate reductase ArsC [bacterium SCSIO 12741]|nr:arsenate reductase ArsC [bacterium SCSIO 12741]